MRPRFFTPRATHDIACFIFVPSVGWTAPLGLSIVEMPTDVERFEHRDPHTSYVAYVPKGGLERGRILAGTGGDSPARLVMVRVCVLWWRDSHGPT